MIKNPPRKILLNPGPCTTTHRVKNAQIISDICPREEEFSLVMNTIRLNLINIINADPKSYSTVLFGGSGTAAVESVIASVISEKDRGLLLINGMYGKRIHEISKIHKKYIEIMNFNYNEPIDFSKVENYLKSQNRISHLIMVHNETTTGLLNSIDSFSKVAKKFNLITILDAMSSFGAIPINYDISPIDFLISSSNKCLQGMPGISFSICNVSELQKIKSYKNFSFYLDLFNQFESLERSGQMRFTPPVQTMYAFDEAIKELMEEGVDQRFKRYTENWNYLRSKLKEIGFKFYLKQKDESHILTCVLEPLNKKYNYKILHDLLYKNGFTIYPGKLDSDNTFRIANIGSIYKADIKNFINRLKSSLMKMGIKKLIY